METSELERAWERLEAEVERIDDADLSAALIEVELLSDKGQQ